MMYTELDRLIAMLEPQAGPDAIAFVKREILGQGFMSEYVPQRKLDDEVFAPVDVRVSVEDDWSCTKQGESISNRSEQQRVDVYDVEEYNPNDPRNW